MRKIRIFAHISLDGVIQTTDEKNEGGEAFPHGDWTARYRSAAGREKVVEAQGKGFDLLLGRRTYNLFANYWPKAESSPIADGLNAATKYVATHNPDSLGWGPAKGLGADIVEGIRDLKSKGNCDLIVWGSTTVTSTLFEHGLVDEVLLIVYPVLVGQGKRFFSGKVNPRELAFVNTKAMASGILFNTYKYVGPLKNELPKA